MFLREGVLHDSNKTIAGGGLVFSTLLVAMLTLMPLDVTANAAGGEYTGLSAACNSQYKSTGNDSGFTGLRVCSISVHRKGAPDLNGTYAPDSYDGGLSTNIKDIVTLGTGYSTVQASYITGKLVLGIAGADNAAFLTQTATIAFSLKNPPASTASVMQMPTTGAPEGLTAIGVAAIGVGLLGLAFAGLRRKRQ